MCRSDGKVVTLDAGEFARLFVVARAEGQAAPACTGDARARKALDSLRRRRN
jgi:hypothetical protein